MTPVQKTLLLVGVLLVVAALAWPLLGKIPFGRLPGDIVIRREGMTFYVPVTSMIVLSIVVSVLVRLFGSK